MGKRILLVEDEEDIRDFITVNLQQRGFTVYSCVTGIEGLAAAQSQTFDLILLDWMLPEIEGIDICKALRQAEDHTPVMMLTAKDTKIDRVLGLEMGADDYLTKPFSLSELEARVKALLRRATRYNTRSSQFSAVCASNGHLSIGHLMADTEKRELMVDGTLVSLTLKEFDLLVFFMKNPGKSFSRQALLDEVWGPNLASYERTVSSHINRLRSKIEPEISKPVYIKTVWGVGYRFTDGTDLVGEKDSVAAAV